MGRVHIIGAGLAGLATAVELAKCGWAKQVLIHEASPHAGGRCRSYLDPKLGVMLDNGNHLVMSGNTHVVDFLTAVHPGGPEGALAEPQGGYNFIDLKTGARWGIAPNRGLVPFWLLDSKRRVPGTRLVDYASLVSVLLAGKADTVGELVPEDHPLNRSFWEPLTIAALNTAPKEAAASLMRPVLLRTFARGWSACKPLMARKTLGDSFIAPAIEHLTQAGATLRFGKRLRAINRAGGRVTGLRFVNEDTPVGPEDIVVLATPAWIAPDLAPEIPAPPPGEPILNVHYRLEDSTGRHDIIGVLGGMTQWVFVREEVASVTISAAGALQALGHEDIAQGCWSEVVAALNLPKETPMPAYRLVSERRATFAQTPDAVALRPPAKTDTANLILAGDWTDTGLPATIEGALASGRTAGRLVNDILTREASSRQSARLQDANRREIEA
jgi:hydroxysqualene dehydroxylase